MKKKYLAKTLSNLEPYLAEELKEIGAEDIQILNRAVSFTGTLETLYKANYLLRTAIKIFLPIEEFKAPNETQLYNEIKKINWAKYMSLQNTFAIETTLNTKNFTHSLYVSLKVKDAIADRFRENTGKRPNVDLNSPDIRINLHIFNDQCTISLDSSGESLHKRGYRSLQGIAPLNEVLAAGLIKMSGWNQEQDLVDPFCGSGTILIEGAMAALNIPAQYNRKDFCFMNWKGYDELLFKKIKDEAAQKIRKRLDTRIYGCDISGTTLDKARENVINAGINPNVIQLHKKDFRSFEPYESQGIIISNPPYGERINIKELETFFKSIGDQLKSNYNGFEAWFLAPKEGLKFIGLKPSKKFTLLNAKIEVKFQKYELYSGSRKAKNLN